MTAGYVANIDNGHSGYFDESLVGVTYCGETFDPDEYDRKGVYGRSRPRASAKHTLLRLLDGDSCRVRAVREVNP